MLSLIACSAKRSDQAVLLEAQGRRGGEVRLVRMVQYPEARPVQSRGLTKARPVQALVWWPRAGCVDVGEWRRRTKKQTRS